jgi:hypothetical protein
MVLENGKGTIAVSSGGNSPIAAVIPNGPVTAAKPAAPKFVAPHRKAKTPKGPCVHKVGKLPVRVSHKKAATKVAPAPKYAGKARVPMVVKF